MIDRNRASLVFRIDEKLLQRRPPRLTLAGTLTELCKQIKSGDLEAGFVIDILAENRLLPYMLGRSKNIIDLSLGRNTNASKVGDLIVSEECIKGNYTLCTAFLEFVLTALRDTNYRDTTKSILASVIYIANEIYPSHHIWTYKNINDMNRILCLCTEIFHHIILSTREPINGHRYSELEIVSILSLSQNQAHKQLIEVIVSGKNSITKKIEELQLTTEASLKDTPLVVSVRQSLFIFNKLLSHSKFIKEYCDIESLTHSSNSSPSTYQHGASSSSAPTTTIERALFDTNIRPGLLQHLFSYIYQKKDSTTACLAVDLIKNIATKFSMSLMACLGSEADNVCEFFVDCLSDKEANVNLEVAILDLLSTCVKHQPGLIELFLNFKKEQAKKGESESSPAASKCSLEVVMNLLKECRDRQEDDQKLLHTYVMKFILTFWQKHHSAIEQFDKAEEFWESVAHPLVKFLDNEEPIDEGLKPTQSLNDKLKSYAFMILAREIFCLHVGIVDRKMNPKLRKILDDVAAKNLLGKYSLSIRRKYMVIADNLDKNEDYNKLLMSWRDFLISFAKYKPFEISTDVQNQIVEDLLTCLTTELRLGEQLNKERITAIGDTILLVWTKWMAKNSSGDHVFNSIHELLYLVDSYKEFIPFSFLLTFQTTLNLYLVRHREYLIDAKRTFDLLTPALQLMQFSLKIMEKYLVEQMGEILPAAYYKPGMESRLCLASIMTTRFIIDVSRKNVDLWLTYLQTNLRTDVLVQFISTLMNKRIGPEICLSVIELLLCLSSIKETAHYLNKAALVNQVNMIVASAYERPYAHLSQLAPMNAIGAGSSGGGVSGTGGGVSAGSGTGVGSGLNDPVKDDRHHHHHHSQSSREQQQLPAATTPMEVVGGGAGSSSNNFIMSDTAKIYLDNMNSDHKWLPIHWHTIRLNISMISALNKDYMATAVEYLSIHCIRICELFELLRTKPRLVNMEEALQMIYLINLVLRHGPMWRRRSRQSHDAISEELAKTAYTLATSALPPPTTGQPGDEQLTSIKPRDCLVYARCCYDFGKYTEAERVLFQTKFGDKNGFIKEAAAIYGDELSGCAFHLAALICLKTNRQSDSIDFALQVFADDPEHLDIVSALSQDQAGL